MKKCSSIAGSKNFVDKNIDLCGWIKSMRVHSKVAFCDLGDSVEKIQVVFTGKILDEIKKIPIESVVNISGLVVKRQDRLINQNYALGDIEFVAENISIFSVSDALPFSIDNDTRLIDEAIRLKHRYLDLRSERMQRNMRIRHEVMLFFRNHYNNAGFIEVETPMLTKGTPEGAREFIVPSRIHKNSFYVLPQSPQQYKQLLMVGGIGKYFQVARCFRDEDQRGDRQPEFTQFDLEMSFVDENDIMQIVEESIIALISNIFPDKKILSKPFPRMTYEDAVKKYKCDKPDIRENKDGNELAFCWVTKFPLFEKDDESETGITSAHHPFTMPCEDDIENIENNPLSVKSTSFDLVLNGYEISSGSVRIHDARLQEKIFLALGLNKDEIESKFGHMLKAFSLGVPPHAGTALGMDRLIATILDEDSIREVIAFPKNGEAKDLLMGAPSELLDDTLHQAGIDKMFVKKKLK